MCIPDKSTITYGRANPVGINYLYTSDSIETVLAEVRAWKGAVVSVAEITISPNSELHLLDLTRQTNNYSPFRYNYVSDLTKSITRRTISRLLSSELSTPIHSDTSIVDYIPTQYICEMVKLFSEGVNTPFDGIKFKSSVGNGNNVVLFNMNKVSIRKVKLYTVSDVKYTVEKYK